MLLLPSENAMLAHGAELASTLKKGDILALHGDLGAGKTTLAKGIISELTGENIHLISSPTFTYVQSYEAENFALHHFDLYRMDSMQMFLQKGFCDYFDKEAICIIEWPERIQELLPKSTRSLRLTHTEDGARRINDSSS